MIGSGLQKFARQNGMKIDCGVGYGVLKGYGVTLQEGNGHKQMVISTTFPDAAGKQVMEQAVGSCDLTKQYRITNFSIASNGISVVFQDNPGTMKKFTAFVEWFFPILDEAGATKANVCIECGMPITDGITWLLRGGVAAVPMHSACACAVREAVARENKSRLEEETGSYGSGALGAILGAVLGAVVWALVLMLGYVAGLVGLLIGFLSEKGYTLLKGKQGKGKVPILILAIVVGVILGTLGGTVLTVMQAMQEQGVDLIFLPEYIELLLENSEFTRSVVSNGLMGLVFAALGTFGILQQENSRIAGEKPRILK